MTRAPRHAALICLTQTAFALLALPALHVLVHYREHRGEARARWHVVSGRGDEPSAHGATSHGHEHGAGAARDHASGHPHLHVPGDRAQAHELDGAARDGSEPPSHHHHPSDDDGPHGAGSLEHLATFFLEPAKAALAQVAQQLEVAALPELSSRRVVATSVRAHAVRGPPRLG